MAVQWQNASWLKRLIDLARPNNNEIQSSGLVFSTQLVNDARYRSSREQAEAGFWVETLGPAAAGQHMAFFFEAIDAPVIRTCLLHALRLEGIGANVTLSFELVADPATSLVWAAGPLFPAARGGDLGVNGAVRMGVGQIATANLPPGRSIMPGTDVAASGTTTYTIPFSGQFPAMFSKNAALFFNLENAATGARSLAIAQGVRD